MNNVATTHNNSGYWAGITFGKAGVHKDLGTHLPLRNLQANAWYEPDGR